MTFQELQNDILSLRDIPGVDWSVIGYSVLGTPIYAVHVGRYEGKQVLVEGAIHAREWITTPLLIKMVQYYATQTFEGGMYFIPLSNPDGVQLALDGLTSIPQNRHQFLLDVNYGARDFSLWKANISAVDLNVNFDALWGQGTQNVRYPSSANFIGYEPNSQPEVQALINFTNQVQPDITLSYHTKGEVIYYGFETLSPAQLKRDYRIATQLSAINGYPVIKTEGSVGGYSDWVSLNLGVPAFTIEVGNLSLPHPITEQYLNTIYEQNKDVPLAALNAISSLIAFTNRSPTTKSRLY